MAKIIKTTNQEAALRAIVRNLKTLAGINAAMVVFEELDDKAEFSVTFMHGKARAAVPVAAAEALPVLTGMRDQIRTATKKAASKYSIELDDSDIAILEDRREEADSDEGDDVTDIPDGTADEETDGDDSDDDDPEEDADDRYAGSYGYDAGRQS